jgi:hypothetical protein
MPVGEAAVVETEFKELFQDYGVSPQKDSLNLPGAIGFASSASRPDGRYMIGNLIVGIWEVKGGEAAPLAGWLEAFASASRVACNLVAKGVPIADVIVPTNVYTGGSVQFGATIVLEPFFPVLVPVSGAIDLATFDGCVLARAHLEKAKKQADELGKKARGKVEPPSAMALSLTHYHIKVLDEPTLARGLDLFGTLERGLRHMICALNLLYASEDARPYVVFPLALRTPNKGDDRAPFALVFPNLANEGYKIGYPPAEVIAPREFIEQLRTVAVCIGKAGVVHGDLYPSNIMWKRSHDGGEVLIKIIDWDAAHFLCERDFVEEAKKRLKSNGHPYHAFRDQDINYVEKLRSVPAERWGEFVMKDGEDARVAKKRMDTTFFEFVTE